VLIDACYNGFHSGVSKASTVGDVGPAGKITAHVPAAQVTQLPRRRPNYMFRNLPE
jgi:hypothetical protein